MNMNELHWAAGFLEGEGAFILRGKNAPKHGISLSLKASQVNPEPLYRLQSLFGGSVYGPYKHRPSMKIRHQQPFFEWQVGGQAAARAFMTCYVLMSVKRKREISSALARWKLVPVRGMGNAFCCRGHEFTVANTYLRRGGRVCRKCTYLRVKTYRQRKSLKVLHLRQKEAS